MVIKTDSETGLLVEEMYNEIKLPDGNNSVLVLAQDPDEFIELVNDRADINRFSSITTYGNCQKEILYKKFDLVFAYPTLSHGTYIDIIIEMFSLIEDKGQLVTTCLKYWIEGKKEKERLFRLMVEKNGFYKEIGGESSLILLILSK